jgi:hypothetical protein
MNPDGTYRILTFEELKRAESDKAMKKERLVANAANLLTEWRPVS